MVVGSQATEEFQGTSAISIVFFAEMGVEFAIRYDGASRVMLCRDALVFVPLGHISQTAGR